MIEFLDIYLMNALVAALSIAGLLSIYILALVSLGPSDASRAYPVSAHTR